MLSPTASCRAVTVLSPFNSSQRIIRRGRLAIALSNLSAAPAFNCRFSKFILAYLALFHISVNLRKRRTWRRRDVEAGGLVVPDLSSQRSVRGNGELRIGPFRSAGLRDPGGPRQG